ncbi:M20/M25/M40 family metallo-hydrolase [Bacillus sp. CGMCC 1.16541]|uniref:M20 family metallopeptidase n=1 Tax=Bacillus sp. CGMCC 1.16541 TaxID=2185143 RepID=UPI00194F4B9B|nr:M20/M25/M40 family metallo-hydrolase [Bacillus sp. CGMCC 1.16541]
MDKMLHLLTELLKIDSSTKEGANKGILYCQAWLQHHGLQPTLLTNNGYHMLITEIGSGSVTLTLNGHVDVVSGNASQFVPFQDGNRLYGRGAADMKGGLAAMMAAVVELKDQRLPCKVQLQIVSDEETGGFHCSKFLSEQGYVGDFLICGEPTMLHIGLQAKGILQADVTIRGQAAHGSRPWEGINAIETAMSLYQRIFTLPFALEHSPFYEAPSINLAKIQGGDAYNKVPDCCTLSLDIRYLPHQSLDEIILQLEQLFDEKIKVGLCGDPIQTQPDDRWVKTLVTSIAQTTKTEVKLFGQHGSADGRFFSRFGIPAVEFGPSGDGWHGDKEFVLLSSLYEYKNILTCFVMNFCVPTPKC